MAELFMYVSTSEAFALLITATSTPSLRQNNKFSFPFHTTFNSALTVAVFIGKCLYMKNRSTP